MPTASPIARAMRRRFAESLRPRERVRPSEWVTKNVRLANATSARPGPFDVHWKPWTRYCHDAHFENPAKSGTITIKPGQVGDSEVKVNLAAYVCVHDPGPIAYITTDEPKATEFACDRFQPRVETTPQLRALFDDAGGVGRVRRDVMRSRPYRGGRISFLSARATNEFIGTPYKWVFGDEFQACTDAFDGDLFTAIEVRRTTFKNVGGAYLFGHPYNEHQDIHGLWERESTRECLVFDCPHCKKAIFPRWRKNVKVETREDGSIDPLSAVFVCEHCGGVVSDGQRAAALVERERGGTSRFESELTEDERRARRYVGLWFTRLCDPSVTVLELAREWAAKVDEASRQEWMNKRMGEPYKPEFATIRLELVKDALGEVERVGTTIGVGAVAKLAGGPLGCRMFVAGVDVQAPKEKPFFYVAGRAFYGNGRSVVTHLLRVQGFDTLHEVLRGMCVSVDGRLMGLRAVGIDVGFHTQAVLESCRSAVYSVVPGAGRIECVPIRYQTGAGVGPDSVAALAPEHKRKHPLRPELPALPYYYLWRHHWVERFIRSLSEKRLTIAVPPGERPPDLEEHLMSNTLRPVKALHGFDVVREEYWKPDEVRDDWLQAMAFAEAAASVHLGLDQMFALAQSERPVEAVSSTGPGFRGQVGGLTGQHKGLGMRHGDWRGVLGGGGGGGGGFGGGRGGLGGR